MENKLSRGLLHNSIWATFNTVFVSSTHHRIYEDALKSFESQQGEGVISLRHSNTTTVQSLGGSSEYFGLFERLVDVWQWFMLVHGNIFVKMEKLKCICI